jgi:MFS family permease
VAEDRRATGWRAPWGLVVALGLTQIISWGSLYYAFSLVIGALGGAVGAEPPTVVGAFSVALLAAGAASAPIGHLIDRHGGRWVMATGSAVAGGLLIALGHVQAVWQLYLVWAGLGVAMAATLYDPAFAVLAQVFKERQRKAITALTLFGGFASTVFWPLTQWLIQAHGWQQALVILGLLNLLLSAPLHAVLLPGSVNGKGEGTAAPAPAPAPAGGAAPAPGRSTLHAVLRDPTFHGLCAAFTANALVFSAMSVHLISLLQGKGLTVAQAAWVGALIGPMQVLGRVLEFAFLSRTHPTRVGMIAMWLLPASLVLLALLGAHPAGLACFALLYGCGNGVMTIVRGAIPAELYGREHYGAVNGAMATPVLLAKAAGPIAASFTLLAWPDPTQLVLLMAGLAGLSAAVFAWTVHRRPHPRPAPTAGTPASS